MLSDAELQRAVEAELAWDPSLTAGHIGVTARNGVVTLTGHVGTAAEKKSAELSTRRVKGVKAIAEDIEVRLAADMQRSDEQIAACVLDRIFYDTSVPKDGIRVEVAGGWVTLTGQVEWFYQKKAAAADICRMLGVRGVTNSIAIKPTVNAGHISDDITHALHRSWFFDPKTVNVTAQGGDVRLTGTVNSLESRKAAARAAWAAPGVTSVENDIAVV
jgi:osmotically-inducible protein OsmY